MVGWSGGETIAGGAVSTRTTLSCSLAAAGMACVALPRPATRSAGCHGDLSCFHARNLQLAMSTHV